MMRILAKKSIIDKLSLSTTFSRLNNTFIIMCIDNVEEIKFFKNIILFRHASILKKLFSFSDAYLCFLNVSEFYNHMKICLEHLKNSNNDGINIMFGYVYDGIFVNLFNMSLLNKLVLRYNFSLDFENYMFQTIVIIVLLIEVFIFSIIDIFLLNLENNLLIP